MYCKDVGNSFPSSVIFLLFFFGQVQNAQKAGFVAAIVHNVDSDVLVPMSGESGECAD
jgi:hypothetical protein